MNFFKLSVHGLIRRFCYLFYIRLPYGPVKRFGKPDLSGRVILAPTHNNFFCDISIAGVEGPKYPRWLAKIGLFDPPFGNFLRFMGCYPIVRILDASTTKGDLRALNEQTSRGISEALKEEGLLCIFPEGNCLDRPGLNIPLKNGIAKFAFAAEAESGFTLGIRIVPMGIDYHARTDFVAGVTIRYGQPILVKDYEDQYKKDPVLAAKSLMAELTNSFLGIFPHFSSYEALAVANLLEQLGVDRDRIRISQKILAAEKSNPENWKTLAGLCRDFSATHSRASIRKIGNGRLWRTMGFGEKFWICLQTYLLLPFALFSFCNNLLPSLVIRYLSRKKSELTTDYMTIHITITIFAAPVVYLLQYIPLAYLFRVTGPYLILGYFYYVLQSIICWALEKRWCFGLRLVGGCFPRNKEAGMAAIAQSYALLKP